MNKIDLAFYFSLLRRRLPLLLPLVLVIALVSFVTAYSLPGIYQPVAKLLVESPQISSELAPSTVPLGATQQMQVITEDLTTRDNLLKLASDLQVYAHSPGMTENDIADDMRGHLWIAPVQSDANVGGNAVVFAVAFEGRDPVVATKLVNRVVALILQRYSALRTQRARGTSEFFNQEVQRLDAALKLVENNILAFKNANLDALPDSLDFRRNQQSTQQQSFAMLKQEEASLITQRSNLIQAFQSTGTVAQPEAPSAEQRMLEQLQQTMVAKRGVLRDDSPGMIALRQQIASLQASIQPNLVIAITPWAKPLLPNNIITPKNLPPELRVQLMNIDLRLRAIATDRQSIEDQLKSLAKSIAATPTNEITLNALERDYQNLQSQYNAAIARLAEASTGEQIESRLKGERLTILEPALPPTKPVKPSRMMIAGGGSMAGIGLAFGIVVLLELMRTTVWRPVEITKLLEAEPIGVLPYVSGAQRSLRWLLLAGGLALVLIVAALIAIDRNFWNLQEVLGQGSSLLGRKPA